MTAAIDHTGRTYGRLEVLRLFQSGTHTRKRLWWVRCICGTEKAIDIVHVTHGGTKSCGCANLERVSQMAEKHKKTHGEGHSNKTTEYRAWSSMKERCCNPNRNNYSDYGGRGIKVCERWINSYENFLKDMGRRPSVGFSLDRIDVNGDYSPENCRWTDQKTQQQNRRNTLFVEVHGKRMPAIKLARLIDVDRNHVYIWMKVQKLIEGLA
jgi:hypothetical protein